MARRRWVWWALAVYAFAAIAVLVAPVSYSKIVSAISAWLRTALGLGGFGAGWIEFGANVLLFLPLGLLLTLLFRRPWVGFIVALALSVSAELVQNLLPNRVASPRDVLANAFGAAVGAALAWLIIRHRRSARPTATTRAG